MIKKFSYLFVAFMFSFMCFSLNVNAEIGDVSDSFNRFDYLDDEDLSILDNYLKEYVSSHNLSNYVCYMSDINQYYANVECATITFDSSLDSTYYGLSFVDYDTDIQFNYSIINKKVSSNPFYGQIYYLRLFLNNSTPIFWTSDDFIIKSGDFVIDDTEYSEINEVYKQYYDFRNYLVTDMPLYSLYHLKYGGWKGYSSSLNLVYCIDNVCDESTSTLYEYKYAVNNEEINLKDLLDSSYNGYKLDNSKSYVINAGVTESLNVYYYSTDVEYTINYYYDDVLQEDLTEVKKAVVNSTITLTDLEDLIDSIYFLDKNKDYSIVLSDSNENVINVYYYSYDMNYNVNVYLDDIYYQSHSYIGVAKRGSEVVLEDLVETINIYTLDNREYKLSVGENSQLNYINVYYYSENYNTKYQDIDTTGKYFISFDWVYIKDLFSLNGNFTQTEQFLIVYVVNILFYVIVALFIYVALKMINKLFSFFRMF